MSETYRLKEVRIQIRPGVELVGEISSVTGVTELLAHLRDHGFSPVGGVRDKPASSTPSQAGKDGGLDESPASRIERNAGLQAGALQSHHIIAFKDEVPQFLRPSSFGNVTDAALILIHAVELGLRTQSIDYEAFKALFDNQNVKSGTPLSMLLTNLRNSGYLDKNTYRDGRKLRLTPKGDQKAIQVLKDLIANGKA